MIKKTLYFGNPVYLSLKNKQLVIHQIKEDKEGEVVTSRPVEDIGIVLLDHGQITITHNAIKALQDNMAVIISCDDQHLPHSMMLPLYGHTLHSKKSRHQLEATQPLKKSLWQQTVIAKIKNQIKVLNKIGNPTKRLDVLVNRVQSGDPDNIEGQASVVYWQHLFPGFTRDRYGDPPNNLLNYGYAIIRSIMARALVGSGLIPVSGIFHKNQYNAFCLADDIMEPFRPFVDLLVHDLFEEQKLESFLDKEVKQQILSIATADALFGNKRSPLMIGMSLTSASLADCFEGKKRKIIYPQLE